MYLKTKLIAAFMAFALLVLFLYGSISYHVTQEVLYLQGAAFVKEQLADVKHGRLFDLLKNSRLRDAWVLNFNTVKKMVVEQNGHPVEKFGGSFEEFPLLNLVDNPSNEGYIHFNGSVYVWAKSLVDSNHVLVGVKNYEEFTAFARSPAKRLLVGGFVVIWLSVWAGLFMAARISRGQRMYQRQLLHGALHDGLTGLPNRHFLTQTLAEKIKGSESVGIIVFEIKRFKTVNDTLGYQIGDELLIKIAQRVGGLEKVSITARTGADEFTLLVQPFHYHDLTAIKKSLTDCFNKPFELSHMQLEVRISAGMAVYPEHGDDALQLIRCAGVAMSLAKQAKQGLRLFHHEVDSQGVRRLQLMSDCRAAIEHDDFVLNYQPIIRLADRRVFAFEALMRWRHDRFGVVMPDEFLPLVEQSGYMGELTEWLIRRVARQIHQWQQGRWDIPISINLSAYSLRDTGLPEMLSTILDPYPISHNLLTLEITETDLMEDHELSVFVLRELQSRGFGVSIDDFGTGYSSMAYLRKMPVNEIKIDRSFLENFLRNTPDRLIMQSMVQLIKSLGHRVVVEGVEQAEVIPLLHEIGCDCVQGFYFGRPMDWRRVVEFLEHKLNDFELSI